MIRLLIAFLIVGLASYFMLNRQDAIEKPEAIYKQELEKVKGLEQQMMDDAASKMDEIDNLSR